MKYRGVGYESRSASEYGVILIRHTLKTCKAKTSARELKVYEDITKGRSSRDLGWWLLYLTFSPPDRFEMFFQLFLGGITEKMMPSENGSMLSTSSSSALPPSVIIYESWCHLCHGVNERNGLDTHLVHLLQLG